MHEGESRLQELLCRENRRALSGCSRNPYEQGFDLRMVDDMLELPLRWRKPRHILVNSMGDLFHEDVPVAFIEQVFDVMVRARGTTSRS